MAVDKSAVTQHPVQQQLHMAVKLPAAALTGWASLWVDGLLVWQRLCEAQMDLLTAQASFMRSRNWIAKGADWMDHYGKRARDVDIERV